MTSAADSASPLEPWLPDDEASSGNVHLDRLRAMARVLDDLVGIPGTRLRVGLDGVLGLVPGVGDSVTGAVSFYAMYAAYRLGAPPTVLARMLLNVLIDLVVGSLPFVGDLFDFGWKSNRKNVRLVERYAFEPERVKASSRVLLVVFGLSIVAGVVGIAFLAAWLLARILSTTPTGLG